MKKSAKTGNPRIDRDNGVSEKVLVTKIAWNDDGGHIVDVVLSNRWFLKKDKTIISEKKDRESQILKNGRHAAVIAKYYGNFSTNNVAETY